MVSTGDLKKKLYEYSEPGIRFEILDWTEDYLEGYTGKKSMYMHLIIYDKKNPGRGIRVFFYENLIIVEFKFMSGQNELPVLHAVVTALLDLTGTEKIKHFTREKEGLLSLQEFKSIYNNQWYENQFLSTCEDAFRFIASSKLIQ